MDAAAAFPPTVEVPVRGGARTVVVRPWTMAQRRELRPRIEQLLRKIQELGRDGVAPDLVNIFSAAEEELTEIARATVKLPDPEWDELYWEDLPNLIQAIWETSIARMHGGGLVGKVVRALSARPSTPQTSTDPRPSASPSSPADGAATPSS